MTIDQADALASAPEVGVTAAAAAAPGQQMTERDRARKALGRQSRQVEGLESKVGRLESDLAVAKAQLAAAVSLRDFYAQHPALKEVTS